MSSLCHGFIPANGQILIGEGQAALGACVQRHRVVDEFRHVTLRRRQVVRVLLLVVKHFSRVVLNLLVLHEQSLRFHVWVRLRCSH